MEELKASLRLRLRNARFASFLMGYKGNTVKDLEKKTGTSIELPPKHGDIVTISGPNIEALKNAKNEMETIIKNHNYHALINREMSNLLRDSFEEIIEKTQIHIKINPGEPRDKLVMMGHPDKLDEAKKIVHKKFSEFYLNGWKRGGRKIRQNIINAGWHDVNYIHDQVNATPSLFFAEFDLNFTGKEEEYDPEPQNISKLNLPSKLYLGCPVLAPFQNFMYRAECLGVKSYSERGVFIKVKFYDFGNQEVVNALECQDLNVKYHYPALAQACKLRNIVMRPEGFKNETCNVFQHALMSDRFKVFLHKQVNQEEIGDVEVYTKKVGKVSSYLIEVGGAMGSADVADRPVFNIDNTIGSSHMLYVSNEGWSSAVLIEVVATRRVDMEDDGISTSSHFDNEKMRNSLQDSIFFCRKYLMENHRIDLMKYKLRISAKDPDNMVYMYHGNSAGAVITLCILSEILQKPIPHAVALTGAITSHGDIYAVGSVREKVIGAKDYGKKLCFIPKDNEYEPFDYDMKVIAVSKIHEIIRLIW